MIGLIHPNLICLFVCLFLLFNLYLIKLMGCCIFSSFDHKKQINEQPFESINSKNKEENELKLITNKQKGTEPIQTKQTLVPNKFNIYQSHQITQITQPKDQVNIPNVSFKTESQKSQEVDSKKSQQVKQHQNNHQRVAEWKSQLQTSKIEGIESIKLEIAGEAMKIGQNDFASQLFQQIIISLENKSKTLTDQDNLAYARTSYSNISIMKGDKKYEAHYPKALYFYNLRPNLYLQQYLSLKSNVAYALVNQNEVDTAITLYLEILQTQQQYYSKKDDRILYTLNNLILAISKDPSIDKAKLKEISEVCHKYLAFHDSKEEIYTTVTFNLKKITQEQ